MYHQKCIRNEMYAHVLLICIIETEQIHLADNEEIKAAVYLLLLLVSQHSGDDIHEIQR